MTTFPGARAVLAATILALVAFAVPASADEVQEAAKLFKSGQPQQALERVNRALAAKPRDPQARFLKGLILAEQGITREASEIFLKLTQDYPELPEPYNNLAVLYAAQGQYDKARAALEQSIRTHPSYATAYENLGDVYAKLASQAYDKALQIDSANPGAKNKLALVRELVGGAPRAVPAAVADKGPAKPAVVAAAAPPAEAKPPAPAPAAAAKPAAEKPAAEKPVAKSANAEVLETVNAWAKAWAAKDIEAYLAFYARDFQTPNGEARSEWEKGRRQRVGAPKSISVSVEAPRVSLSGEAQASVTFRQHYRSDVIKSSSTKTLVMVKSDGRWLIRQEKVAN
jgi:tetratricopeptide (TPR) repeat protein